jgi:hypothetical protein
VNFVKREQNVKSLKATPSIRNVRTRAISNECITPETNTMFASEICQVLSRSCLALLALSHIEGGGGGEGVALFPGSQRKWAIVRGKEWGEGRGGG